MGMDVCGGRPKEKAGEYFGCQAREWELLWDYCCNVAPAIARKVQNGYTNDWDGLGGRDAEALAAVLRARPESGHTARWAVFVALTEAFDVGLVREFVRFLEACGGFAIG